MLVHSCWQWYQRHPKWFRFYIVKVLWEWNTTVVLLLFPPLHTGRYESGTKESIIEQTDYESSKQLIHLINTLMVWQCFVFFTSPLSLLSQLTTQLPCLQNGLPWGTSALSITDPPFNTSFLITSNQAAQPHHPLLSLSWHLHCVIKGTTRHNTMTLFAPPLFVAFHLQAKQEGRERHVEVVTLQHRGHAV